MVNNQEKLKDITSKGFDELAEKNTQIKNQQNEIVHVTDIHRAKVEGNIRELDRERSLIKAGQIEVGHLLTDLRSRIGKIFLYVVNI